MLSSTLVSCAFKSITRHKNITYLQADSLHSQKKQELNVFAPRHKKQLKDVFIFIYGGNWNSGRKGLYNFFGSRMARKNVVTVVVDYPKSPAANYNDMVIAVAKAVQWTKNNIDKYGGNPNRIFISGHSAGGHLAALASIKNSYFDTLGMKNPVKGIILIDAAGLDMYGYLKTEGLEEGHTYFKTFTTDSAIWKQASPLYYLHAAIPALLIYRGSKTYPSISESNEKFVMALKRYTTAPNYHILKGKKHVAIITQFFNPYNVRYKEIIAFMKAQM